MINTTRICPTSDRKCVFNLSILISESKAFDHFAIPNQCPMGLLAGVTAKAISSIDCEIDQVTAEMFAVRAQIGWFRISVPFDPLARRIEKLGLEQFVHCFFVVGWIRSRQRGIR